MAKKMTAPESSSPESPAYWTKNFDASDKRRDRQLQQFARFGRWHRGDLRDVVDPRVTEDYLRWQSNLENMTHLATVASLADLLFRWPQFVVNTPYVPPPPQPMLDPMTGMPSTQLPPDVPTLFNPVLAKCQTTRLAYILRRVNFLVKARRALQDCLLGGIGILKITTDQELVVDEDVLAAAKAEALQEIQAFLSTGAKMIAQEKQIHSIHIDLKRQLLTQAERGDVKLPKAAVKYVRKHIAVHEAMKGSERPTETIRNCQVRVRRINPMDYFFDPTVDDRDDASWKGTRFLMRKADVLADDSFDMQARLELKETQDRWETRKYRPNVLSPGSFEVSEAMVMVNEVFDLVTQKRYLFADGANVCLIPGEDRQELKHLQPSGPFEDLVFVEDALEGHGIAPPSAFESEQAAATAVSSSMVRAAIQSVPKTLFDMSKITADDAKRVWDAGTGELVGVTVKSGDPKYAIKDAFYDAPPSKIEPQNLEVLANCIRGIERRSGLGVAKMGGGEQSPTATGAALGAEASQSISEDRGALTDHWLERSGRMIVRLDRRFTPASQWIEVCGDEAIEAIPAEGFTLSESMDDIAIELVPGSSRRRNTSVDQKQLTDLVLGVAPLPMFAGPAGSKIILQMIQRIAADAGAVGLDWRPLEAEAEAVALQTQQGPPGAPPDEEGAEGQGESAQPPGPRSTRSTETQGVAQNDINQGVSNPGAGRVATGASTGDKIRAYRGAAVKSVANRG